MNTDRAQAALAALVAAKRHLADVDNEFLKRCVAVQDMELMKKEAEAAVKRADAELAIAVAEAVNPTVEEPPAEEPPSEEPPAEGTPAEPTDEETPTEDPAPDPEQPTSDGTENTNNTTGKTGLR